MKFENQTESDFNTRKEGGESAKAFRGKSAVLLLHGVGGSPTENALDFLPSVQI